LTCGFSPPSPRPSARSCPRFCGDVFLAATGTHDDWDEYDRVMAEERRTAVVIKASKIIGNR
jgi:hypothetical protein